MADDFKEIKQVNETLTMHMGPNFILVNISVDYMDGLDSQRVEESISRLNRQIKEQFPRVKRVFVEAQALSDRQS